MGVPITFLDRYNPQQFQIIGITKTWFGMASKIYDVQVQVDSNGKRSFVTKLNDGPAIKLMRKPSNATHYEIDGDNYIQTYARILIRHRRNSNEY